MEAFTDFFRFRMEKQKNSIILLYIRRGSSALQLPSCADNDDLWPTAVCISCPEDIPRNLHAHVVLPDSSASRPWLTRIGYSI